MSNQNQSTCSSSTHSPPTAIQQIVAEGRNRKFKKILSTIATAIRAGYERRQHVAKLSSLDNHMLADMGIERHQILDIAHGNLSRSLLLPAPGKLVLFQPHLQQPSASHAHWRAA